MLEILIYLLFSPKCFFSTIWTNIFQREKIFQQPKIAFTKTYADMISVNEAQT